MKKSIFLIFALIFLIGCSNDGPRRRSTGGGNGGNISELGDGYKALEKSFTEQTESPSFLTPLKGEEIEYAVQFYKTQKISFDLEMAVSQKTITCVFRYDHATLIEAVEEVTEENIKLTKIITPDYSRLTWTGNGTDEIEAFCRDNVEKKGSVTTQRTIVLQEAGKLFLDHFKSQVLDIKELCTNQDDLTVGACNKLTYEVRNIFYQTSHQKDPIRAFEFSGTVISGASSFDFKYIFSLQYSYFSQGGYLDLKNFLLNPYKLQSSEFSQVRVKSWKLK